MLQLFFLMEPKIDTANVRVLTGAAH